MIELISLIVLIISLLGMGIIVMLKLPVLVKLPEASGEFNLGSSLSGVQKKVKDIPFLKSSAISYEMVLHKLLSRFRILTLKTDHKTSNWLQSLREKSQRKRFKENDNYWKEIKKDIR